MKEYKLKTVEDILKVVNKDNVDNFLIDFRAFLEFRLTFNDINPVPEIIEIKYTDTFQWIDDGKNNAILRFEPMLNKTIKTNK